MLDRKTADDLGNGKIGSLLLQYSIPAIIGMVASSLYNIIDRVFIGQGVGALAISGLAITLPIMNMAVAFGAWVGIGASAMVSIRLGEKKGGEANLILGNALVLNILISIAFSVIVLIYLDRILYLFGASRDTLPYAREFMQIILVGNIFTHIYWGLNSIMRSSGYPRKAMVTTLVTIGINLLLAPLFIFAFRWGIRGAAAATVLSQVVGTVWVVLHFMSGKSQVHFERGRMGLRANIVRDILSVGMPSFLLHFCACFIIIVLNLRLVLYGGDFAVGAFGIINSIVMFFIMVVIGLNQGMQPIVGYNYGAHQSERVFRAFRYTAIAATCITAIGFLMGELIPGLIARAFTTHQELIDLSTTGMRIVLVMFPLVGFQMVTSNLFQSIGKAKTAIFLSLSRQVMFLIPLLFILSHAFGLEGVWLALPASDVLASLLTLVVLKMQMGKIRSECWQPSVKIGDSLECKPARARVG
ncbi:MAG: MATE family efflux transporter [Syntrophaceae bacterium]|nr:MATE family efflux transporter [Syntrophaceae bacterium]